MGGASKRASRKARKDDGKRGVAPRGKRRVAIPSTFELGSLRYTVTQMEKEALERREGAEENEDLYGIFDSDKQTIHIAKPSRALSAAAVKQAFFHELAHALLWTAASRDFDNEKVVDSLGHALLQYMQTRDK